MIHFATLKFYYNLSEIINYDREVILCIKIFLEFFQMVKCF